MQRRTQAVRREPNVDSRAFSLDRPHKRDVVLVAGNQHGYIIVFTRSVEEHVSSQGYVPRDLLAAWQHSTELCETFQPTLNNLAWRQLIEPRWPTSIR